MGGVSSHRVIATNLYGVVVCSPSNSALVCVPATIPLACWSTYTRYPVKRTQVHIHYIQKCSNSKIISPQNCLIKYNEENCS